MLEEQSSAKAKRPNQRQTGGDGKQAQDKITDKKDFPLPWEKVPRSYKNDESATVTTWLHPGRSHRYDWPAGMHINSRRAGAVNLHVIRDGVIDYFDDDRWLPAAAPSVLWIPAGQAFSWRCSQGDVQRTTVHLRTQNWAPANDADAESLSMLHQLEYLVATKRPGAALHRRHPTKITQRTARAGRAVLTARATVSVQRPEIRCQSHPRISP